MNPIVDLLLTLCSRVTAWLPHERGYFDAPDNTLNKRLSTQQSRSNQHHGTKIRGMNLRSQFVIEPWMARKEWADMGCGNAAAEWDCVVKLGQEKANESFRKHWKQWVTEQDLDLMKDYGLNTIRVLVGYWIFNHLVHDDEHCPQDA